MEYIDVNSSDVPTWVENNVDKESETIVEYNLHILNATQTDLQKYSEMYNALHTRTPTNVRLNLKVDVGDSISSLEEAFSQLSGLKTLVLTGCNHVTNASRLVQSCYSLESVDISALTHVTNAENMFAGSNELTSVDLSSLTSATNISGMFDGCTSLKTLDVSSLKHATGDMRDTFNGCHNLESIKGLSALSHCTTAIQMFVDCRKLKSVDTSGFTSIDNAENMFSGCSSLTSIDLTPFKQLSDGYKRHFIYNCPNLKTVIYSGYGTVKSSYFTLTSEDQSDIESVEIRGPNASAVKNKVQGSYSGKTVEAKTTQRFSFVRVG